MRWVCYMVRCADNTLYTGITTDLKRRLQQHNGSLKGGAKYTRSRRPVHLVYSISYADKISAASRERYIKKLSRAEKEKWAC